MTHPSMIRAMYLSIFFSPLLISFDSIALDTFYYNQCFISHFLAFGPFFTFE